MRKGKEFDSEIGNADLTFDCHDDADTIMEDLNTLLKKRFGIEIITHETHSDFYAFSVKKVKKVRK